MRHRSAAGVFAKSAHRRLRLPDELPAIPEEPGFSRVGWRRQHDVRSRATWILRCGKPVPFPLVEAERTRSESSLAERGADGLDAIYTGESDTERLSAAG